MAACVGAAVPSRHVEDKPKHLEIPDENDTAPRRGTRRALRWRGPDAGRSAAGDRPGRRRTARDDHFQPDFLEPLPDGTTAIGNVIGQHFTFVPNRRLRSNIATTWQYGDWGATLGARYLSALDEDCSIAVAFGGADLCSNPAGSPENPDGENQLDETWYFDLQGTWDTFVERPRHGRRAQPVRRGPADRVRRVRQQLRPAIRRAGAVLVRPLLAEVLRQRTEHHSPTCAPRRGPDGHAVSFRQSG
jgi:hypothetical protein